MTREPVGRHERNALQPIASYDREQNKRMAALAVQPYQGRHRA